MSPKMTVDPFPRLDSAPSNKPSVKWSSSMLVVDGHRVEPKQIREHWDRNSEIRLHLMVRVSEEALERIAARRVHLSATVSCRSTAWSRGVTVPLRRDRDASGFLIGTVDVPIRGSEVSEELHVEAALTAPWKPQEEASRWLSRRIIASRVPENIDLVGRNDGFPTSATSFKQRRWRRVPWMIDFESSEPSDPFSQSVRLYLNTDFKAIRAFIEGADDPHLVAVLQTAVMRSLIQHASLMASAAPECPLDREARENPESIARAAQRTAVKHLGYSSLQEAVRELQTRPDRLEQRLMESAGYLA